jgi:hypothetical protein
MIILHIGRFLYSCPNWYRNFYNEIQDQTRGNFTKLDLERGLEKLGGKLIIDTENYPNSTAPDASIEFENDEDATNFILKYS